MEKGILSIGQRLVLTRDKLINLGASNKSAILKKGTVFYVGADKEFFHMTNGDTVHIPADDYDVSDGYSVYDLGAWIYSHLEYTYNINEMLERGGDLDGTSLEQKVSEFIHCIGDALTNLGFTEKTNDTGIETSVNAFTDTGAKTDNEEKKKHEGD